MENNKLSNGVKKRYDGKGDPWALEHRFKLGSQFLMQDMDAIFGNISFGQNTGEKLFIEYAPDKYRNTLSSIRKFTIIALFDRKFFKEAAFCNNNKLSTSFYLYICRALALSQSFSPKFFFVIGKNKPPWEMIELNIKTGDIVNQEIINDQINWLKIWDRLGLIELRNQLKSWSNFI